ncbi:putative non-specific serine/threonine protein kinase [Dioscorea sansibarensis]
MVAVEAKVSPEAEPETLAEKEKEKEKANNNDNKMEFQLFSIGDLVWGRKGADEWWPGMVCDPSRAPDKSPGRNSDAVLVAYFGGDDSFTWCHPSQLKPFKLEFPKMSAQSESKSFVSAVENALEEMERCLELEMSCSCVVDEFSKQESRKFSVTNYEPIEFLKLVFDAAKDALAVNMLEITMLRSWALAIGRGGGQHRRKILDLIDKIDFDAPRGELIREDDRGVEVGAMPDVSEEKNHGMKKRSMTKLIAEMDLNAVEVSDTEEESEVVAAVVNEEKHDDDVKDPELGNPIVEVDEGTGSGKRERKKSKYLSYPYTDFNENNKNSASPEDIEMKMAKKRVVLIGSPRKSSLSGDGFDKEEDQKSPVYKLDATPVSEILAELEATAVDGLHLKWNRLAKTVRGFFAVYRDSVFSDGSEFQAYQKHLSECGCMNGKGLDTAKVDCLKEDNNERSDKLKKGEVNGEILDDDKTKRSGKGNTLQKKKARKDNVGVETTLLDLAPSLTLLKRQMRIDGGAPVNVSMEFTDDLGKGKSMGGRRKGKNNSNFQVDVDSGPKLWAAAELSEALEKPNGRRVLSNGGSFVNPERMVVEPPKGGGKSGRKRRNRKESITGILEGGKSGKKRKRNKDGNSRARPEALLLSFAPGTILPSKADLITEFSKYGSLNEAGTEVHEDSFSARVVYTNSSDVEKALNSQDKARVFAPPNATYRVHYLPGNFSPSELKLSVPQPLPYIRKNLERMISTLTGSSVPGKHAGQADGLKVDAKENLVGEMQGLLEKVNQLLDEPPTGTSS